MSDLLTPQSGPASTSNPKAEAKAAKAYAKASRKWYQKKRWWLVAVVFVIVAASAASGGSDDSGTTKDNSSSQSTDAEKRGAAATKKDAEPAEDAEPEMTSGQENALKAGQNYIDMMPFSKAGLIQQLSSEMGDGYTKADATFAANNVDVDWNAEAVEAAQNYLDTMPFSRDGLIEQLSASMGDKFTKAQAVYGADKVL